MRLHRSQAQLRRACSPPGSLRCPRLRPQRLLRAAAAGGPECAAPRAAHAVRSGRDEGAAPHDAAAAAFPRRELLAATAGAPLAAWLLALAAPGDAAADEGGTAGSGGITKVFVVGATGQTGRRVVQQLRAAGLQVRAGVRDLRKAQSLGLALDPVGIELVTADVVKQSVGELAAAIGDAQAVICATGYTGFNPSGFGQVDEEGNIKLVDAAKRAGVQRMVLLSSLLTNAPAVGQRDNPNYRFLNLFGAVLDHKLVAENYLRASGLGWAVVRPGGLSNEPPEKVGNLVVSREDSLFALESDPGRAISRDLVAEVLVAALLDPAATNKVIEIVSSPSAPPLPRNQWFANV